MFNELFEEKSSKFRNLEKRINPANLTCKYKLEGGSLKDFRNYQNLIDLFENLRDGNLNLKEALKDQNLVKRLI